MRRVLALLALGIASSLAGPISSEAQEATTVAPPADAPVVLPLNEETYGSTYPSGLPISRTP